MAVATLYVTAQGVEFVTAGKRRWVVPEQRRRVDPHWFRGNSYFRIGWDWVKAALEQGWQLIHHVRFTITAILNPLWRLGNNMSSAPIESSSKFSRTAMPPISFVSQPRFGEIVGYFENRKTNGLFEGIDNKLKLIKRRGYGFTNVKNFELRCLMTWYFTGAIL